MSRRLALAATANFAEARVYHLLNQIAVGPLERVSRVELVADRRLRAWSPAEDQKSKMKSFESIQERMLLLLLEFFLQDASICHQQRLSAIGEANMARRPVIKISSGWRAHVDGLLSEFYQRKFHFN